MADWPTYRLPPNSSQDFASVDLQYLTQISASSSAQLVLSVLSHDYEKSLYSQTGDYFQHTNFPPKTHKAEETNVPHNSG